MFSPVARASVPTGLWKRAQVMPVHTVDCIIGEEARVKGTGIFYDVYQVCPREDGGGIIIFIMLGSQLNCSLLQRNI